LRLRDGIHDCRLRQTADNVSAPVRRSQPPISTQQDETAASVG
jgi:hypothetical protein